jgi:DNA sulfur modification protein DndD
MKLISIRLCNFRQFYGRTPTLILASGKYNTTIIHGNNGAGKTTILNAFTWVLYKQFTAAFSSADRLINHRAITEAPLGKSVECWVEIEFEHDKKRYQVKRKCYAYQNKNETIEYSKSQLFMLIAGDDGRWYHPMEQPEEIIDRILPENLHYYFFFDGEQIDRRFRSTQQNNIAEDTKELLGVKVLDRAIEHLKKAKRTLEEELKAIGNSNTKKLLAEQNKLEKELENLQQDRQEIVRQLVEQEELKKSTTDRLLELSGIEELQQLKIKLEEQEKVTRENLVKDKNELKILISSRGYTVFLAERLEIFSSFVERLRQKGELPSGIKKEFIQELLMKKQCICGTELVEGSEFYLQVQSWFNKAGIADVEESLVRLEAQIIELNQEFVRFWQEVDLQQGKIDRSRTELARIENQLDEIKTRFRNYPDRDIKSIQNSLDRVEENIKKLMFDRGANQQQIETLQKQIETIAQQIIKQKVKEEKQSLAQRRIETTQESIERIIQVRSLLEKEFRLSLETRVREIFSSISFTPYVPQLSPNYELSLVENTSGRTVNVAASTGENQILSLSFIGGIIDRVREWSAKNTLVGLDSSTFPIVMDSPFGSLDEIYRRKVARSIPQLANQLVVLVTKTQWRQEVEQEMKNFIGQEYILVYNSPKTDCEEDSIELNGEIYPLVKRSIDRFEYTEIVEVKRQGSVTSDQLPVTSYQ